MKHKTIYIVIYLIFNVAFLSGQELDKNLFDAIVKFEKQDYKQAAILFSQLIETNKNNAILYKYRGACFYDLDKTNDAIRDFLLAEKQKKGFASLELAAAFAKQGNASEAVRFMKRHLESKYKVSESRINQNEAFANIEKTKKWKKLWEKKWYSKNEDKIEEVEYLLKNKNKANIQQAEQLLDEILNTRKKNHKAFAMRGKLSAEQGNYKNALADFDAAIDITKRNAEYFFERAEVFAHLKKNKKAAQDLDKAIELNPYNTKYYKKRAIVLSRLDKYDDALKDIQLYINYFPDNSEGRFVCGMIFYNTQNYLDALKQFNTLLEKDKTKAKYFVARANVFMKAKRYEKAENDYGMALDLDPNDGETFYLRGIARFKNGKKKKACFDWKQAFENGNAKATKQLQKHCNF
ncbi:MAG: hypothetical protein CSB01_01540 [Bacteroidia bacterium]|nr:MAG: hypothetical protein CSB01_01540 [Bacteroidia bacterium]